MKRISRNWVMTPRAKSVKFQHCQILKKEKNREPDWRNWLKKPDKLSTIKHRRLDAKNLRKRQKRNRQTTEATPTSTAATPAAKAEHTTTVAAPPTTRTTTCHLPQWRKDDDSVWITSSQNYTNAAPTPAAPATTASKMVENFRQEQRHVLNKSRQWLIQWPITTRWLIRPIRWLIPNQIQIREVAQKAFLISTFPQLP